MAKLNIAFDIDGVVLQYTEEFAKVFKQFGGVYPVESITEFNFFNVVDKEYHNALYLTFGYMMQSSLPLCTDFTSMIKYMVNERQQKLIFVTARQEKLSRMGAENSILKLLQLMFGIDYPVRNLFEIHCVNGNQNSKLGKLQDLGIEYFIDDRRKTCLELASEGIKMFMPRRSWNTIPEDTTGITRYNDTSEIVKLLRNM